MLLVLSQNGWNHKSCSLSVQAKNTKQPDYANSEHLSPFLCYYKSKG